MKLFIATAICYEPENKLTNKSLLLTLEKYSRIH